MWLWILVIIILLLNWSAWFVLSPEPESLQPEYYPLWFAVAVTVVVLAIVVGLYIYRRIRAARAARALEKAIAQQAQEQVAKAKPEDTAEVRELHRKMMEGMKALKQSRLAEGKSGDPLYSLPWYAMVGPPGSGKTTALRYSGLSFPYLDPDGGGVRGVGGTRNCDWWFCNQAILLDTAGRYTSEEADYDEWMAFLGMLRTYRPKKPLNGVIVTVSVSELIDASEDEIERTAERIRERIDEMQEQLKMVMPVYVMFSKCDLVAGFVEFFGDLKRSERGQAWGATLPLNLNKDDAAQVFENEFDLLVDQLHKRAIRRVGSERTNRRDKEKIYQFPLEFAAIKRNLADFLGAAFAPMGDKAAGQASAPILRGFYFASGTQEGKPLDRVVGAMGRAFGLRAAEEEEAKSTESKSFFLREMFENVVFPDQAIAGRTEGELRRMRFRRVLVAAAAMVVAIAMAGPAGCSFSKNRLLLADVELVSNQAGDIKWADGRPLSPKLDQLDELRERLQELDGYQRDGVPWLMGWRMYQGETVFPPLLQQYIALLRGAFIAPVKSRLEDELAVIDGSNYGEQYDTLRTYLLLNDVLHVNQQDPDNQPNTAWETDRLTARWAKLLRQQGAGSEIDEDDLRKRLNRHSSYYVDLLARAKVKGEPLKKPLVEGARARLSRVGRNKQFYERFVVSLIKVKRDPLGADTVENRKYPPLELSKLFEDRAEVLTILSSRRYKRENKYQQVRGPFNKAGRAAVLAKLKNGAKILEREKWVVPIAKREKDVKFEIEKLLKQVRQDYDGQYIAEWTDFFRDIAVAIPVNNLEAIGEFRVLSTPEWPYMRLLKVLRDNTQFGESKTPQQKAKTDSGVLSQIKRRARSGLGRRLKTNLSGLGFGGAAGGEYVDPIPLAFKAMVEFGFPPSAKKDEPPPPGGLAAYVGELEKLAGQMTIIEEGPPSADTAKATDQFKGAVATAETKLLTLDRRGQNLMRDLLMNPLRQSYKAMVNSAGGAASGLWEVAVWPPYRDTIMNRYPFNDAATRDASFEDAVAFFQPKEGVLWGFYDAYLKSFHRRVGFTFVPSTQLGGVPRPARRYSPFSPNMYNCLERASIITDALFSQGDPGVKFKVNLTTVSPIVSEIVFELDGQKRSYRNEREFWRNFTWPGKGEPSAAIRVKGAGGLNEEIRRDGPWGLFRLLEAGRTSSKEGDDKTFVAEWQMAAPPVTVRMQIRPTRANHPLSPHFFRNMNCPAGIGDTFGG